MRANRLEEAASIRKEDKKDVKSVTEQLKTQFFHAALVDLSLSVDGDLEKRLGCAHSHQEQERMHK